MAYRGESRTAIAGGPQRSKTVMGRKLRVMTVEKGLLRETKAVQRMIDALVECRVCFLIYLRIWFTKMTTFDSFTWMI